jgi:hypothetical protein
MHYRSIKWLVFTTLFLTAPAMLFLVMSVMFMPAVLFTAGLVVVIQKLISGGPAGESLTFIVLLGIHIFIYTCAYYGLAALLARLLVRIRNTAVRTLLALALCGSLMSVALLPVYGSGGHGPMRWLPLAAFLEEINRSHGPHSTVLVYVAGLLAIGVVGVLKDARRKPRPRTYYRY